MIWRASGISNTTINGANGTFEEKLEACIICNTSTSLAHLKDLLISILWRIWRSRNELVFQQMNVPWWKVIQQAKFDAEEWGKHWRDLNIFQNRGAHFSSMRSLTL